MSFRSCLPLVLALAAALGGCRDEILRVAPVGSIEITGAPSAPLAPGDSIRLSARALSPSGAPLRGRIVGWSSSDSTVARVDAGGVVRAVSAGSAVIEARVDASAGSVVVTVTPPAPPARVGRWTVERQQPGGSMQSVWAAPSGEVFAAGGSRILRYTASGWESMAVPGTPYLAEIWGASRSDVFAVGYSGVILHYDGTAWRAMESGTNRSLLAVWGSSGRNVYAAGFDGVMLHYDGSAWRPVRSETSDFISAIWGSSAEDVWAVGSGGSIVRYDGTRWSPVPFPLAGTMRLVSIWGSGSRDVYVGGTRRSDGRAMLAHFDGSTWREVTGGGPEYEYSAIWGSGPENVFVSGSTSGEPGFVLHFDGRGWTRRATGSAAGIRAISGTSGGNVFAVGESVLQRFDGSSWSEVAESWSLRDVWGSGPHDVVAVGDGGIILRYDGASWRRERSGVVRPLAAVHGHGGTAVAVGAQGAIAMRSGGAWRTARSGMSGQRDLHDVWMSSERHAFAVGDAGTILRWDGAVWSEMLSPTTEALRGVWGDATGAWAVGASGTILRFDGSSWRTAETGRTSSFSAVRGVSPTGVYAVGTILVGFSGPYTAAHHAQIAAFDGSHWRPVWTGPLGALSPAVHPALWASPSGDLFLLARTAGIQWRSADDWESLPRLPSGAWNGIWGSAPDRVRVVGDDGSILLGTP